MTTTLMDTLRDAPRILIEAPLKPVQGDRFQPTGFADIGAARYQRPDGTWMLLVESAQSMANRLEATIMDPGGELVEALAGLSYVRSKLSGATDASTTSLLEAHRINSPYIISDAGFQERFAELSGYRKGTAVDWQKVARALFALDVNSLLHGAFMANFEDGRIKLARSISAFIEAEDVREAVSGGVKNNPLDPTGTIRAKNHDRDVYGNVPYQRVEYTAKKTTAFFNIDLRQIRGYDLGPDASELLVGLSLYKVRRFLEEGTRLRTACDLEPAGEPLVEAPNGFTLPATAALLEVVRGQISACKTLFADPPVTELTVATKAKS